jgi:hypothetical protein
MIVTMPKNTGTTPPHELVDVKLRNGFVVRRIDPKTYRWKPWPEGESGGDVIGIDPAERNLR